MSSPVLFAQGHQTTSTRLSLSPTISVPSGSMIVVCSAYFTDSASPFISDNKNTNSYTDVINTSNNNAPVIVDISFLANTAALSTSNSITIESNSSDSASIYAAAFYVTSVSKTVTNDGSSLNSHTGSSSSPSVTSGTPGSSGQLFIGFLGNSGTPTITQASGWNSLSGLTFTAHIGIGWLVNGGTGTETFNPTLSASAQWAALVASFPLLPTSFAIPFNYPILA